MLFTRIAYFLAILISLMGFYQVYVGFSYAGSDPAEASAAMRRYTTHLTTGEAIDAGFYKIVFALLLGTLAEISFAVRRR